jgi:hypothetical protein
MNINLLSWLMGIVAGVAVHSIYLNYKYTTFAVPLYKTGDCLSNGLFFESVIGIRKSFVLGPNYVLDAVRYHSVPRTAQYHPVPRTVDVWIVDRSWVRVDPTFCEKQK